MSLNDDLFDVADNDAELNDNNYDMDVDDQDHEDDLDDNDDNDDMDNDEDDENDDNDDLDNEDIEDDADADDADDDGNDEGDDLEDVDDVDRNDEEEDTDRVSGSGLDDAVSHEANDNNKNDTANSSFGEGKFGKSSHQSRGSDHSDSNGVARNTKADTTKVDLGNLVADSPPKPDREMIRRNALIGIKTADELQVVPLVGIPYVQQCHSISISEGPKWLLTGGEDGFIRKYDFIASIDGKAPLTVAQKHNLIESVTKAGVIGSYWENEQPMTKSEILTNNPKFKELDFTSGNALYEPKLSPVYALEVDKNGFWCLSGLQSGGICLYTMIYNEGGLHHYFLHASNKSGFSNHNQGHLEAVSVLRLNYNQTSFISGSWDKTVRHWDLNTGRIVNFYKGSSGQISSLQFRPQGLADLTFLGNTSDVDSLFGSDEEDEREDINDNNDSRDKEENASINCDNRDETDPGCNVRTTRPQFSKASTDGNVFMSSGIDGTINIWDARISGNSYVLKLGVPDGVPPWCMSACWSNDGDKIYAGRRNNTVDEISIRKPHVSKSGSTMIPNILKKLLFPKGSGPVTALTVVPNDKFLFCGSIDNIRLYDLSLHPASLATATSRKRATPYLVIPGHHGGALSSMIVDETGRFMVTASGNRGWTYQPFAENVLVYSIDY